MDGADLEAHARHGEHADNCNVCWDITKELTATRADLERCRVSNRRMQVRVNELLNERDGTEGNETGTD